MVDAAIFPAPPPSDGRARPRSSDFHVVPSIHHPCSGTCRGFPSGWTQHVNQKKAKAPVAGKNEYGASSITVLEGLEAVRKRPGMYIGSTGDRCLHTLLWDAVYNSLHEEIA